jgi:tetratricopeptide (TPR) repeat protein
MNPVSLYIDGALIQAVGGILTSVLFFRYRRHCPTSPLFVATLGFFVLISWIAIQFVRLDSSRELLWGFLPFYASTLFFVPPLVAIANHLVCGFVDGLTRSGHHAAKSEGDVLTAVLNGKTGWPEVRRLMDELRRHPDNQRVRAQVAELFLGMAYYDSALAEYRRLAEIVPRGYEHAQVLYKVAYVLIEKKRQPRLAVSTLRQIVRLHPKSYFAAYARRWLNHLEAHVHSGDEFRRISEELGKADFEEDDRGGETS